MDLLDITLIVPTRNRAYTLEIVARSWYEQNVAQIIFVDDAGSDDTAGVVNAIAADFPHVETQIIRNDERLGASGSRNRGIAAATHPLVMFCDDDEFLEAGYARVCADRLKDGGVGAVSGRRVYMIGSERPEQTIARYGNGLKSRPYFRKILCEFDDLGYANGDLEVPFTNAIIVTTLELLKRYGFDMTYLRGNAYREESDYQMNLFVNGYRILMLSEVHSIHLDMAMVQSGGARFVHKRGRTRLEKVYWSVYYTNYFYKKYWNRYAERVGLRIPRVIATAIFTAYQTERMLVRPALRKISSALAKRTGRRVR